MLCIDELNHMKQCYYSYFIDEGRETCWILVALPNLHSQCVSKILLFIAQLCPALCDPMDCSTPGFPVLHHLPELAQTHIHWVGDAIQPSHPLSFPSRPAFNLSQRQGQGQIFASGGQSIGVSALASVLSMNIQDWFPLGLTGLISMPSKGLSRVFSNTTVQKHQFFAA